MSQAKHGLRAMGLAFLAALGLMAFSAAAAQANANSQFLITGKSFSTHGLGESLEVGTPETFAAEQVEPPTGKLYVPNQKIEITCKTGVVTEGKIYALVVHATVTFTECKVFNITLSGHTVTLGTELSKCITHEIVSKIKGLPLLHKTGLGESKLFVLFSPLDGTELFTKVKFLAGLGCVLPGEVEIKGSVVAQALDGMVNPQHLTFSGPIQLLFHETGLPGHIGAGLTEAQKLVGEKSDRLYFGANEAFIESLVKVSLTGPLINQPFGIH